RRASGGHRSARAGSHRQPVRPPDAADHGRAAAITGRGGMLDAAAPAGLIYQPDVLTPDDERALVDGVRALEFSDVKMRGQIARRRTVHFGWLYGYETWRIEPGPPIPGFLL